MEGHGIKVIIENSSMCPSLILFYNHLGVAKCEV